MCQENTQADPLNEPCPLMISAELTDRIYNVVHLSQRHAVHLLVEFMEMCPYLLIVVGIVFVVALVEHSQNRFTVPEVGWIRFDMCFQFLKIGIVSNEYLAQ